MSPFESALNRQRFDAAEPTSVYHASVDQLVHTHKRSRHREAIRRERGRATSGGRLPTSEQCAALRWMYRLDPHTEMGEDWDYWDDSRQEPSGIHPYDVRGGVPLDATELYPSDEAPAWRVERQGRQGARHQGDYRSCPACWPARPGILDAGGLSFSAEDRPGPATPKKRIRREAYQRARRRRLANKRRPLDRGPDLTQRESARMQRNRERGALCGQYAQVLQRRLPAAGVLAETLVIPLVCGLRRCPTCFERARKSARYRMEGPYRQFVTFTLSREGISRLHAWRHMSKWVGELMKRLAREADKGIWQCYAENCEKREPHEIVNSCGQKLEYAWVIEPHETPWPHVHVAWSARYVCYDWLREQWREITGQDVEWTKTKEVYTVDGVCRYMTEYMTESVYTEDILAVLYRRRIWTSTVRKRPKWEQGYASLKTLIPRDARVALAGCRASALKWSTFVGVYTGQWTFASGASSIFMSWVYSETPETAGEIAVQEMGGRQPGDYPLSSLDEMRERYREDLRADWRARVHRYENKDDG